MERIAPCQTKVEMSPAVQMRHIHYFLMFTADFQGKRIGICILTFGRISGALSYRVSGVPQARLITPGESSGGAGCPARLEKEGCLGYNKTCL